MPRDQKVDHGRGFDMHDNIMWSQRVEKEERAVLGEDTMTIKEYNRRQRAKQDSKLRHLEAKLLGKDPAMRDSMASAMYRSNGLPEQYRALNRWPVQDACLITCHPKKGHGDDLVPKLRFNSSIEKAMWVPGTGQIIRHRPEFYFEDPRQQKKFNKEDAWRMPAAGARPPNRLEPKVVEAASSDALHSWPEEPSRPAKRPAQHCVGGLSESRSSFLPGAACSSTGILRSTAGSMMDDRSSATADFRFQIGAPFGANSTKGSSFLPGKDRSLTRSRSSTLMAAGDAAMPQRVAARRSTPLAVRHARQAQHVR